jgi:hypothetical protein
MEFGHKPFRVDERLFGVLTPNFGLVSQIVLPEIQKESLVYYAALKCLYSEGSHL